MKTKEKIYLSFSILFVLISVFLSLFLYQNNKADGYSYEYFSGFNQTEEFKERQEYYNKTEKLKEKYPLAKNSKVIKGNLVSMESFFVDFYSVAIGANQLNIDRMSDSDKEKDEIIQSANKNMKKTLKEMKTLDFQEKAKLNELIEEAQNEINKYDKYLN